MSTRNISTKELDELCQKYSEGDLDKTPKKLTEKISLILNYKDLSEKERNNLIKYKSSLEEHIANYQEALKNLNLGIPNASDKLDDVKLKLRTAFNLTVSELKRDYVDKIDETRSQNKIIIEPETGQSHLSQSCSHIIEKYFSYMDKEEKEDEFWEQLIIFYEEINKVKVRYELENLPDEVNSVKNNIEKLKRNEEGVIKNNSYNEAKNTGNSIKMHYLKFIILVARIKEKALEVENRKFFEANPSWTISFLTKYYMVICNAGGLEQYISLLSFQQDMGTHDIKWFKSNIYRQKIILDQILRDLESLNNLDHGMDSDFKQNISKIITLATNLKSFYKQDLELQEKPEKIYEFHDPLKTQILNLYEETIKRM